MTYPDHSADTSWSRAFKKFFKTGRRWAPAALSGVVTILSLATAMFSASAANSSADAAKQSLQLQHALAKRALEDQRARVEFTGGTVVYSGSREVSSREAEHIYIVELKLRNYGVRPALDARTALDIAGHYFFSAPRTVPGGTEIQVLLELKTREQLRRFDAQTKIGTVFYDEWPVPSSSSNNDTKKTSICGPVEIRSISVHKTEDFQGAPFRFALNPEVSFQYDRKKPQTSFDREVPFRLSQIISSTPGLTSCQDLQTS